MSETLEELDDLEPRRRTDEAGESFMVTFAAVGALVLREMDAAEASVPTSVRPISIDEAQTLLRGPTAPAPADALGAPAATDAAFIAAIAALSPPADDAPPRLTPTSPDMSQVAAPTLAASIFGDETIGSSAPPASFATMGPTGLVVYGDNLVVPLAPGATLTIRGENDLVLTSANDTVDVLSGSSVTLEGDGAKVNLASGDNVSLSGVGYQVRANGTDDAVSVLGGSQATVYGDGVATHVTAPDASVTVIGSGDKIDSAAAGANVVVSGGATVDLTAGDVVNLMDLSTLTAHGAGAAYLGANDYLSLFGAYDVFAPVITGASVIAAFSGSDTLNLHSDYASVASLLGASTQAHGATTLHLDGAGDTLTLIGLGKRELTALAAANHLNLY